MNDDLLKKMWKDQPIETIAFSSEEIQKKAAQFQRRIAWRNGIEYVAAALVIATFCFYLWKFPFPLMRIGSVLEILGVLVAMYQLHQRASVRSLPTGIASMDFYRAALERQRDALQNAWLWYVAPLVPGQLIFVWGMDAAQSENQSRSLTIRLIVISLLILCALIVAWLNRHSARKLQTKIDQLDQQATNQE